MLEMNIDFGFAVPAGIRVVHLSHHSFHLCLALLFRRFCGAFNSHGRIHRGDGGVLIFEMTRFCRTISMNKSRHSSGIAETLSINA
jgi:hypothetical protein